MELKNDYLSASTIYSQLALKKGELASIDKKDIQKSTFEKNDEVILGQKNYDKADYSRVIAKFKSKDNEIRTHEQTHASLGTTTSGIKYNYQTGPDGKLYATGGYVTLNVSIPKDESAAIAKLNEIQKASSSPIGLSGADASISQAANLNKMLILSQKGDENENR